jgi:DNA invertase Pin-like site-specific DNA recombinase
VQCVVVYKIDRLSRDVSDYSSIKNKLNQAGIKLLSVTENIDDTPAGKFMGNVMATIAQWDNDVRSERDRW